MWTENLLHKLGWLCLRLSGTGSCFDMDPPFLEIYNKCKDFTMTSAERMFALYKSIEYIVKSDIPGDIVECGVWQGGSSMLCSYTLKKFNQLNRNIYLYDTFSGMSMPTDRDVTYYNESAEKNIKHNKLDVSLEKVKNNIYLTDYPKDKIFFIKGKVEETIPQNIPGRIALLRLDTDWYESTRHELLHLYPLLSHNGVLIIDDYGHWKGAREATDQYFQKNNIPILLNRIDYTGRIGIKTQ